jgi:hypothetical protein
MYGLSTICTAATATSKTRRDGAQLSNEDNTMNDRLDPDPGSAPRAISDTA